MLYEVITIIGMTKLDPSKRVKTLTDEEVARLRQVIESQFKVEGRITSYNVCYTKLLRSSRRRPVFEPTRKRAKRDSAASTLPASGRSQPCRLE